MTIKCLACQNKKPETDFSLRTDNGKKRNTCKKCRSTKESVRQAMKAEQISTRRKAFYKENRDTLLAKQLAYAQENRERESARGRNWRRENPEKVREINRRYYVGNPGIIKQARETRYARVRGAEICDLTTEQWIEILKEHDGRCVYCGSEICITKDHDIPVSRGGNHTRNNVVPACRTCNCRKQALTGDEFRARLASGEYKAA